jgi:hypothetical protein
MGCFTNKVLVRDLTTPKSSNTYQVAVQVVHDNFNDFAIFENIGVDVSVDGRVRHISLIDGKR